MSDRSRRRLDVRIYRVCLRACPPAFHQEYSEAMVGDFVEARDDAAGAGRRAVWLLRLGMAIDLVRTAATQWVRTGWPVIALVSIVTPLLLAEALVAAARQAAVVVGPDAPAEMIGVVVLATVAVVLIATTIALTLAAAPRLRQRRR